MKKENVIKLIKKNHFSILGSKMEGLIHNLNSPLNNVIGYALLMKKKYPEAAESEKILNSANKINEMLQKLGQATERYGFKKKQLIALDEIVTNELEIVQYSLFFKHKVEICFTKQENVTKLWFVYSDLALIVFEIFELVHSLIEQEEEKIVLIETNDRKQNQYLIIEVKQSVDSKKLEKKLILSSEIIMLLLDDYQGNFSIEKAGEKIKFVVKIPKGANQCPT